MGRASRPAGAVATGERVFLRRGRSADREEFSARMAASRRLHRGWVSPLTEDTFELYLSRARRSEVESLLVCRREDAAIAGFVSFSQITYGSYCTAMCGYVALAPFAGQGYLTEGLGLALRHAFIGLALHRIEAHIQPTNERSRAIASRCGFQLEGYSPRLLKIGGRWRDHERWAILVEDWRRARGRGA